jgi:surface protein
MEQYQKRGALGPWTDEYAMCATVYYCLTGRVPPDAPQRMKEDVHPAWEKIPGLSSSQRMVLEKGMSLRGKDRYPNVRELMAALYGQEPQPAAEPIQATKPVQPMEMPRSVMPEPIPASEPEKPLYTEPMVTRPVERVEEKPKKKRFSFESLIAVLVLFVIPVLLVAFTIKILLQELPKMEFPSSETTVAVTEAVETTVETEPPPAWKDNILMEQTTTGDKGIGECGEIAAFGTDIPRGRVRTVTFQSTLEGAPEKTYDVSSNKDGSVLAWVKNENSWMKDMIIAAEGGINAKYCRKMFYEFNNLLTVTFGDAFHTDDCNYMNVMFRGCYQLWQLDVSTFNTSNVKNMEGMFEACPLQKLDLSTWDTSNVTDMSSLFSNCNKLTELDLTGWDTSNVTDMRCMFVYCNKLKSLDLNHFNTFKVTDMSYMFRYCSMLNTIKIDKWNTSKVKSMEGMFEQCWNLGDLSLMGRAILSSVKHENFLPQGKTINGQPWEEFFQ